MLIILDKFLTIMMSKYICFEFDKYEYKLYELREDNAMTYNDKMYFIKIKIKQSVDNIIDNTNKNGSGIMLIFHKENMFVYYM